MMKLTIKGLHAWIMLVECYNLVIRSTVIIGHFNFALVPLLNRCHAYLFVLLLFSFPRLFHCGGQSKRPAYFIL